MTIPEPNTPQERKWFAEQMGWQPDHSIDWGTFWKKEGKSRHQSTLPDPRTSIADAIELADAVFPCNTIKRTSIVDVIGRRITYRFESDGLTQISGSRCDAICEAVRAKGGNDV